MIPVPTSPFAHHAFDVLAWGGAIVAGAWVKRHHLQRFEYVASVADASYFVSLGVGVVLGAWLIGSVNSLQFVVPILSHSIAGALVGGIVGVEAWKLVRRVRGSTGATFVPAIVTGILIGRWGCFFSGLDDATHGSASSLPWAVDLGDGIGRHPVQIYESCAMFLFLVIFISSIRRQQEWPWTIGFHVMVIYYAVQRFFWEFLKPYPPLLGPLNLFHILMLGLIVYGLVFIRGALAGQRKP